MIRKISFCKSICNVLTVHSNRPLICRNLEQGRNYATVTGHWTCRSCTASYSSQTSDKSNQKIPSVEELIKQEQGEPVPIYGHRCDDYDRFCLVYLGRFPSMSSVPAVVPIDQLKICHDLMRIRYNVWTIIGFTIVSILTKIYYSSQSKKRQEARKKRKEALYNEYVQLQQ